MAVNLKDRTYEGINCLTDLDTLAAYVDAVVKIITEDVVNGVMIARKRLYNEGFSFAMATTILLLAAEETDGDNRAVEELETENEFFDHVDKNGAWYDEF